MVNTPLEGKALELLNVLRNAGPGWHSRAELATLMGKNRLNSVEVAVLDLLVGQGHIEKSMSPSARPHIQQWQYRLRE